MSDSAALWQWFLGFFHRRRPSAAPLNARLLAVYFGTMEVRK